MPRARASLSGLRTDNGKNWETRTNASFENMQMQCGTQANDMAKTANNWKTPGAMVSGRYIYRCGVC